MRPSFVILFHAETKNDHLDLLLELQAGGPLASWRLETVSENLDGFSRVQAERRPDHRREYLAYEGPVSGGRGRVRRVDGGTMHVIAQSPGLVEFSLAGQRLRGRFTLHHVEAERWELRHEHSTETL
ncbi:MAG: hypothetical protein FWE88_07685 [Phycisphaerae bacterium]|nr:hypothetical protein [Phycisphaerae bacterium]